MPVPKQFERELDHGVAKNMPCRSWWLVAVYLVIVWVATGHTDQSTAESFTRTQRQQQLTAAAATTTSSRTATRVLRSQVQQFSLTETWMVLGPDLVGWRLTEARVWAMLRDEEALQARGHTHLL